MRQGDFSELLDPANGYFNGAQVIRDPLTGLPFVGNVIPSSRFSANGVALLNAYPLPTPGFRQGRDNVILNSENPQDQRKDNLRIDYRLNNNNTFTYRYGKYSWTAVDAFRGTFPYARTDWDRPNRNQTASWTSTPRGANRWKTWVSAVKPLPPNVCSAWSAARKPASQAAIFAMFDSSPAWLPAS